MRTFFARLFFFIGFICVIFFLTLVYKRYHPNALAFHGAVLTKQMYRANHGYPARIQIPNSNLDLSVFPTEIVGKSWPTTDKGVSYLKTSAVPGAVGNAIFYGHNWPNLLGSLHNVNVGDEIIIRFTDGNTTSFSVEFITIVRPEQVKILEDSKDARLTLYTCTGFLDSKRLVVTATADT